MVNFTLREHTSAVEEDLYVFDVEQCIQQCSRISMNETPLFSRRYQYIDQRKSITALTQAPNRDPGSISISE